MPKDRFPGGVWPVMMTPFKLNGEVDEDCYPAMVNWYIDQGAAGLFAICQSSEMYQMTQEERIRAIKCVVKAVDGSVAVLASAGIGDDSENWVDEVIGISEAGADAVILITNQFAKEDEDDQVWLQNCMTLVNKLPAHIPLGFYECPYPYKRLISTENLRAIAQTGRFYFLKDTCCDEKLIEQRLEVINGTPLKLYNANTTTLLSSLRAGAAGFSGVMANFHTDLYAWLYKHYNELEAENLQAFLTLASLIERQYYPVNAKYHMNRYSKVPITPICRRQDKDGFTDTFRQEVDALALLEEQVRVQLAH